MFLIRAGEAQDLPSIVAITQEHPDSFTEQAVNFIASDFKELHSLVACDPKSKKIAGFVIWVKTASECEIIWLAVKKTESRSRHAMKLISTIEDSLDEQFIIFAKVAGLKNHKRGTQLNGEKSKPIRALLSKMGYGFQIKINNYWGENEDCIIFAKRLRKL